MDFRNDPNYSIGGSPGQVGHSVPNPAPGTRTRADAIRTLLRSMTRPSREHSMGVSQSGTPTEAREFSAAPSRISGAPGGMTDLRPSHETTPNAGRGSEVGAASAPMGASPSGPALGAPNFLVPGTEETPNAVVASSGKRIPSMSGAVAGKRVGVIGSGARSPRLPGY